MVFLVWRSKERPDMNTRSIGKQAAIQMFETEWWKERTTSEIAKFQLFTEELCCPFEVFHQALEESLHRPVTMVELVLCHDDICLELLGEKDPPTDEELVAAIIERLILDGKTVEVVESRGI